MRFVASASGVAAVAILSSTVIAINPKHHPFLKRQGCYNIDSECSSVGDTLSDCVSYVCDSCTSVDPAIPQCCELSSNEDIADCIEENLGSSSSSYDTSSYYDYYSSYYAADSAATSLGADIGSAATTTDDYSDYSYTYTSSDAYTTPFLLTANPECSSVVSIVNSCSSATPGFGASYDWEEQASCLCYSGSSYAPSSFDDPYSSCLAVLYTSDYDAYEYLTINSDDAASTPCASLSDAQYSSYTASASYYNQVAASSTRTPSTLTPSPGNTPTTRTIPTTTSPSTTTSASTSVPSAAAGNGGNTAGSSGVDALGVQIVFIGLASFVTLLYIL